MAVEQLSAEEVIRFQEREEGIEIGREDHLREQVEKKMKRGKSLVVIADEFRRKGIRYIANNKRNQNKVISIIL